MSARRTDLHSKQSRSSSTVPWLIMVLVWIWVGIMAFCCYGCATTEPPCEPKILVVVKKVPVPCTVMIGRHGPLLQAQYPPHPSEDATEEELKEWALEVRRVVKEREAQLRARIDAMEYQIDEHNDSGLPDCSEVDTEPVHNPTG